VTKPIKRVVILGGGTSGWMTASALLRFMNRATPGTIEVTVVEGPDGPIGVGEATGAMDTMLNKIADFYDDEVDTAVGALTALLEPLMIVILGVIIGGLVVAMYLPIFRLVTLIK